MIVGIDCFATGILTFFPMIEQTPIEDFIKGIPKAELHVHIEGTFEPELMFEIAKRNNIKFKYESVNAIKDAYNFSNLQSFLDIYYQGAGILTEEKDFYDLTCAYFEKARSQNILHSEIFFDPQTHTNRGIKFSTVIKGIHKALVDYRAKSGISTKLIMCFLRDLEEQDAMKTLDEAIAYKEWISAVGLNSSEIGNPPSKFKRVFARAHQERFLTVAHAGEEGPAEYIWEALDILKVSRVDHGIHSLDDDRLVKELVRRKMPLTLCPLSNLKLGVIKKIRTYPLRKMMQKGLLVTINSDDPAYFGGYINENYIAVAKALNLTKEDIHRLAKNSFRASFLDAGEKDRMLNNIDEYVMRFRN